MALRQEHRPLAAEAPFSKATKLLKLDQARGEGRFETRREAIMREEIRRRKRLLSGSR
jgi:hypothetical protein